MAASASATMLEDLHPDVIARALRHMDGPTLAAASCATSLLRSLSCDPSLWRDLCLSSWPSVRHPRLLSLLSGAHRSFFADAHPFPSSPSPLPSAALPSKLISAVDLYHRGVPVFSRVILDAETSSPWFLASPFRVDGLDRKDPEPYPSTEPAIDPKELTLSWVVIDPDSRRAVNLSSRRPVAVERHWYTGEVLVKFAVIVSGRAAISVVTCSEETGHVREVSLTVEDEEGVSVSGRESLGLIVAAMGGGRREGKEREGKESYEEYLRRKRDMKERKARKEGMLDLFCTAAGALVFLSFLVLLAFR